MSGSFAEKLLAVRDILKDLHDEASKSARVVGSDEWERRYHINGALVSIDAALKVEQFADWKRRAFREAAE